VERLGTSGEDSDLTLIAPDADIETHMTEWSVDALQYGKFLTTIFDEWVRKDVGKVFVQIFDIALEAWTGRNPSLCVFSKTCGNAVALEHNGDLYSCDHYVYPEYNLGNVMNESIQTMMASGEQRKFGLDKFDALPEYCRQCDVRFACNGDCPKHRIIHTPDGEPGLSYLCAGYKHFFKHVDPHMRYMANELRLRRSPANIMAELRLRDGQNATQKRPGPNDTCVCGSGRKFKKCCGRRT
jgi:uncharacterized protein